MARSISRCAPPAISMSTSITPSKTSASRSARRSRRRWATRRGINRAGYFIMPMDETLGVAAVDLGGRPHAVVDLALQVERVGDLQSELIYDFFEGFAHGRARQRPREGAVRPVEPPSRRSGVQSVRPGVARGLLHATSNWPACCRARRGSYDCAHRLRRRKPDVGPQGARSRRRASSGRRRPLPIWTTWRASSFLASATFNTTSRARPGMARRDHRRRSSADGRCSASALACNGCSREAARLRAVRGSR